MQKRMERWGIDMTGTTLSALDQELSEQLQLRKSSGVHDIKCHVEVASSSDPEVFKRALVSVLKRRNAGQLDAVPLRTLHNSSELLERLTS
jgi:hypothetical protein